MSIQRSNSSTSRGRGNVYPESGIYQVYREKDAIDIDAGVKEHIHAVVWGVGERDK